MRRLWTGCRLHRIYFDYGLDCPDAGLTDPAVTVRVISVMLAEHEAPRKVRRPRIDGNYQLLLKAEPEAAARFAALADAEGVYFGECLEVYGASRKREVR